MKLRETLEMVRIPALAMAGVAFMGEIGTLYSGALGALAFFIQIVILLYAGYHAVRKYYADTIAAGGMGALVGIIGALSASAAHSLIILAIRIISPCETCAQYGFVNAVFDFIIYGSTGAVFWAAVGFVLGIIGGAIASRSIAQAKGQA